MTPTNNDWRAQLAPGWSGINIAILVVLFIVFAPLGLLMLGYILAGQALGLDLGRPETFSALFDRLAAAFRAGTDRFNRDGATGQPADGVAQNDPSNAAPDFERDRLRAEREALDEERRQFEEEKKAFRDGQQRS